MLFTKLHKCLYHNKFIFINFIILVQTICTLSFCHRNRDTWHVYKTHLHWGDKFLCWLKTTQFFFIPALVFCFFLYNSLGDNLCYIQQNILLLQSIVIWSPKLPVIFDITWLSNLCQIISDERFLMNISWVIEEKADLAQNFKLILIP